MSVMNHNIIVFAICAILPLINGINNQETIPISPVVTPIPQPKVEIIAISAVVTPIPQPKVECTGVHALCLFAACDRNGLCNCRIYDSSYQIAASQIKNDTIKYATAAACTDQTPCFLDEAPVCQAIQNDEYYVNDELSIITSAYSWESFCDRAWPPQYWTNCTRGSWASCMMAPCYPHPNLLNFALCQCDVVESAWIDNGYQQPCYYPYAIKASVPPGFDFRFFSGTEYVFQACEHSYRPWRRRYNNNGYGNGYNNNGYNNNGYGNGYNNNGYSNNGGGQGSNY